MGLTMPDGKKIIAAVAVDADGSIFHLVDVDLAGGPGCLGALLASIAISVGDEMYGNDPHLKDQVLAMIGKGFEDRLSGVDGMDGDVDLRDPR